MPNSADKSPDSESVVDDTHETPGLANSMSDPELDDLGLDMPEFRVPTRSVPAVKPSDVATASAAPEPESDASEPLADSSEVGEDDEEEEQSTHKVSVDELLQEDQAVALADEDPQPAFDRAELVKTVRMDAFSRAQVESGGPASWEISGTLDDQRYAPDVLILPPRVLTRRWQDGVTAKAERAPVDRAHAQTIRTAVAEVPAESELELDSEAIEIEDIVKPPPPKPTGQPAEPKARPGRVRRNTGPLQSAQTAASPQSEQEDDDLSGIVQELLEEKKAKEPPKKKKQRAPQRDEKRINWFNDVFSEEYFRTLPKDLHKQTEREVRFIHQSLGLQKGARVLDLACGFGRHAVELAQRGYEVAGLDVSMPMLQRALAEAQRRGLTIKFVHTDMRELGFNGIFDACFCWQTSFGFFDDRTNVQVAQGVARSLKPGGRWLLDVVNRDHVVSEMPSRTWWEGHECVFLEEVEFDNHFSVLHTKRSFIYEDGSPPREFSSFIRLYSLHELRQLLHFAGFRVLEVSGAIHHRGSYLGPSSPRLIVLAEKVAKES